MCAMDGWVLAMVDMKQTCPGQDLRYLGVEEVGCPKCGYRVEIFSDERTRKCPSCGTRVERQRKPACADWCSAAGTCALLRGAAAEEEA